MKTIVCLACVCLSLQYGHAQSTIKGIPDLKTFRETIDSCEINLRAPRLPVIGLSVSRTESGAALSAYYTQAVIKAGGAPVLIPFTTDVSILRGITAHLDGLIITGGKDVNPLWYKEEPIRQLEEVDPLRDEYELKLIKLATDRNIPLLGICRGEQLINVAFGGTLYQDIPSQRTGVNSVKHVQKMPGEYASHFVSVAADSQLGAIIGAGKLGVNTFHHQAVKDVAPGFRAVAYSTDSVVEAIEAWPERPVSGVQWHPEALVSGGDTTMLKLFTFLTGKADTFRLAKEIHERILSVDTHTDTPLWFRMPGFNIAERERSRMNLPKMEEGKLDAVFLAAFIGQGKRDEASLQKATDRVSELIESIHRQVEQNADLCGLATTPADLVRLKKEGKKTIFIGIENGYAIGKDISRLAGFKKMGVTYMTLCHSYDNDICDTSTHTKKEWDGLSPFGEEVVREMNRLGLMIDLSHAGETTFRDVMERTTSPVICSHSSARALCDHDRNLTDDQLRTLAKNGGVVQVCLLDDYIHSDSRKASVVHAVEHIDHIVKVAGIDHVGIGSDFDGGGGLIGCEGHNDLIQITVKLLEKGYTEEDIAKIWGGNFLRVMQAVQLVNN
ncbi:MAG: gamma-glutamyl-gamma-aminobutyrate hydrolase family protein [Tannerellaceae bacterium]|jgi:microsomal dipeptidase-like Zn-dependent dipeptidase/gamma-glutamyl-gamma-aminobutyrate hydrolase PuuD|nr:gamma-glutamyl-gamma-aminobutyrate hydrolase family protein [Tannerellaceae bacterium]